MIKDTVLQEILNQSEKRFNNNKSLGMFFAIAYKGKIVYAKGYGTICKNKDKLPNSETIWRVASCTKSFTSAVVLNECENLNAKENANNSLKNILHNRIIGPERNLSDQIKVENLLNMSAGFLEDNLWADRQESLSQERFDKYLRRGIHQADKINSKFEYSNLSYALAAKSISCSVDKNCNHTKDKKHVDETCFTAKVRQQIFEPLKLKNASFHKPDNIDNLAIGYRINNKKWQEQEFTRAGAFSAIGGIYASAEDMLRWAWELGKVMHPEYLTQKYENFTDISVEVKQSMQKIHTYFDGDKNSSGYGYGLSNYYEESGSYSEHSGGYPGYSSYISWHHETGYAIFIAENAGYTGSGSLGREILRKITVENYEMLSARTDSSPLTVYSAELWRKRYENYLSARTIQNIANKIIYAIKNKKYSQIKKYYANNVTKDKKHQQRIKELKKLLKQNSINNNNIVAEFCGGKSSGEISYIISDAKDGSLNKLILTLALAPTGRNKIQKWFLRESEKLDYNKI